MKSQPAQAIANRLLRREVRCCQPDTEDLSMPWRSTFRNFNVTFAAIPLALIGCGGNNSESDPVTTVSIDTSAMHTHEEIAQAVASEHGAPGDCEQTRYVLTGENATEDLITMLRERGFTDVSVGGR